MMFARRRRSSTRRWSPVLEAELARVAAAFAPDDAGRYLNFTEERARRRGRCSRPGRVPRLREVKADYDPEGLFRANHAV